MKTLSLPVCRKLSEMGIGADSYFWWNEDDNGTFHLNEYEMSFTESHHAYQLDELPALLRAIGEKKVVSEKAWGFDTCHKGCQWWANGEGCSHDLRENERIPVWLYHFLRICELYAIDGSLGEGSEAERYILDLIK